MSQDLHHYNALRIERARTFRALKTAVLCQGEGSVGHLSKNYQMDTPGAETSWNKSSNLMLQNAWMRSFIAPFPQLLCEKGEMLRAVSNSNTSFTHLTNVISFNDQVTHLWMRERC